jgi:hypothetical protein
LCLIEILIARVVGRAEYRLALRATNDAAPGIAAAIVVWARPVVAAINLRDDDRSLLGRNLNINHFAMSVAIVFII